MSFKHGKDVAVLLDGLDVSSYFNKASLSAKVQASETTTFGAEWKTFIPGLDEGAYSLGGYFDPDVNAVWSTIGDDPGGVLTVCPANRAQGDMARLVKILTTEYEESAPIGGVVAFDWKVVADGSIGFGHVIATDTATADANGTTFDGTASSSGGAVAHLHVLGVSASDSIVVTIEDASVPSGGGSNWATIGSFASKSAIGAERIAIAGTVRRYLRAVYDVTGAGVSIPVVVALARL